LSSLDKAKNDVDYVLLHYIYNNEKEKYLNLSLSPDLHHSQRKVVSTRTTTEHGKTTVVQSNSYVGYALAESLSLYVQKSVGKSPEAEPFFRFIHEIIQKLALKTDKNFVIPKAFFSPSNVLLRKDLRHGPDVTSKKGTRKGNTYVPFSFAKSLECQEMPETLRKTLTGVGATVSKQIDSINHLDILSQNQVLPDAKRYVSLCYALSDDLRKRWQSNAEVIADTSSLDIFTHYNIVEQSQEDRQKILNIISKYVCETVPLYNDATKQKSVQDKVLSVVDQKKKSREKRLPLRN
jgi:flagellar biosynthesis/type III secretory pathway chaperone